MNPPNPSLDRTGDAAAEARDNGGCGFLEDLVRKQSPAAQLAAVRRRKQ